MNPIYFILIIIQFWSIIVLSVDEFTRADFPDDFVFGAGASAYQVCFAMFLFLNFAISELYKIVEF